MGTVHAKAPSEPELFGIKTTSALSEKKENEPTKMDKLPVHVQRVSVEGLTRTKDDVVIKEIKPLLTAKTFQELVTLSYEAKVKMQRLGLFEDVKISFDVSNNKKKDGYDVLFEVTEFKRLQKGKVFTEVANNGGNLVVGAILPNMGGRGEKLDVDAIIGTRQTKGIKAQIRKPLNNNPDITVGGLAFQNYQELPWSGYKQTDKGLAFDLAFPTMVGAHSLQWEGVWRDLGALSRDTSFAVREQSGHSLKSSLKHTFTIDTRDDPLIPSVGTLWTMCQEYAGIGGNVEFAKQDGTFQWNTTLLWDTIFQVSLAAGVMHPLDPKATVNINDRFFLGGPLTLRGFNCRGCGPHSHDNALGAEAYWQCAAHIYSPLPFRPGKGGFGDLFKTHLFVNAGNLGSMDWGNMRGSVSALGHNARWSYGAGVVLYLSSIARLELNYVMPCGVQKGDRTNPGLQFGIGIDFL